MRHKVTYMLFICFFSFQACHKKMIPVATKNLIEDPLVQEFNFDFFQGKGKIKFSDQSSNQKINANTYIRIKKDSLIWINFSFMGISGGKILVNQDSIVIVNHMKKVYSVLKYEELSKRLHMNIKYDVIQSSLLGNYLLSRKSSDQVYKKDSHKVIKQTRGRIWIDNYIHPSLPKIEQVKVYEHGTDNVLTLKYDNFLVVNEQILPYKSTINFSYHNANQAVLSNIIFESQMVDIDKKTLTFPFTIPRGYDRQ